VGFMSGHIAAHAIRKAMGEEAGNAALGLSRQNVKVHTPLPAGATDETGVKP
jgi:hypothetical protein